jgi:hypothetical protein
MRKNALAAVIAAVLFGTVAAQAQEPAQDQTQDPQASQSQSQPTGSSGSSAGQAPVGTPPSNNDQHATEGDYYPFSVGTVGDDPAKPGATTTPTPPGVEGEDGNPSVHDRWMNADTDGDEKLSRMELDAAWPTVAAHFDEIDVDGDKLASRDELRNWHESQKARMEADQPASGPAPSTAPPATVPEAQGPSDLPPATPPPPNDEPATSNPGTTGQ